MTDHDYSRLSRHQKLAVFLIVIGPEAAAEVLKGFDDVETELICREISTLSLIPPEVQKLSFEEFSAVIAKGAGCALGGLPYAQRTLEMAKGGYKASAIVGRIDPVAGTSPDVIKEFAEMDGRQIFNLVKHEEPQTIAFLLSHLDGTKAAEVFALLGNEVREEVIERLGTIESTSLGLVSRIARNLGKQCDSKARPAFHHSGGVKAVADLLNQLEKDASKNLLTRLEERNAVLCSAVRRKLFSFEDLVRLRPVDLQRVTREVDSANLPVAMKSASEPLRERIFASMSKRAAEALKEEIEMLGPVRLRDVEAAQDAVIQVVRRLEEEGHITVAADGAESFVH